MFVESSAVGQSENAYFRLQEMQKISPLEANSGFLSQITNYDSVDKETMVLRL